MADSIETARLSSITDGTAWQKYLEAELERYLTVLIKYYKPVKIILFGSLAAARAELWSDIDLVVVAATDRRFLDRTKEALLLVQPKVGLDVLVYTPDEFEALCRERPFFQQEILSGTVIYERGS